MCNLYWKNLSLNEIIDNTYFLISQIDIISVEFAENSLEKSYLNTFDILHLTYKLKKRFKNYNGDITVSSDILVKKNFLVYIYLYIYMSFYIRD